MRFRRVVRADWRKDLEEIRAVIPEAREVMMRLTTFHPGWRISVSFGGSTRDKEIAEAGRGVLGGNWIMWTDGLSLGAGDTPEQAIKSAREQASNLRDYLYKNHLVEQPKCPRCEQEIPVVTS